MKVPKSKIAENGDYNLSGDRYRIATDYSKAKWKMVELGEVCDVFNGSTPKRTESQYWENGTIPWFTIDDIRKSGRIISSTQQKITQKGYKESSVKLLPKNTVLLCCTASVGEYAYSEIELTTNQQFNGLVVKKDFIEKLNPKFLYWCSSTFKDELDRMSGKATFGFVSVGTLKKFKIPLPPLEIQEQIVSEVEGYSAIISGAKQIVANWKPKIDIDPSWEMVKLGDVCEINPKKSKLKFLDPETEVSFIPMSDLSQDESNFEPLKTKKLTEVVGSYTYFAENDVLLARVSPCFENGKAGIARKLKNKIGFGSSEYIVLRPTEFILPEIAYTYITQRNFNQEGKLRMTGTGGLQRVPIDFVVNFEIPLPPLETQQQIVSQIEAERALVESAKKLIEIYEQKTKAVINKLWEE